MYKCYRIVKLFTRRLTHFPSKQHDRGNISNGTMFSNYWYSLVDNLVTICIDDDLIRIRRKAFE